MGYYKRLEKLSIVIKRLNIEAQRRKCKINIGKG
jgi:hypothetical protein